MIKSPKRGFLVLTFILLFVLFCTAVQAKTTLHSNWYYSGDTFTVGNDIYAVTHYNFEDTYVILDVNEGGYVIREGACKITPTKEYCIDEIFGDIANASAKDPLKFEGGEVYAGIHIIIYNRGPDISISRDFSESTPELNEEVIVTVTIKNTGTDPIDTFFFEEVFPDNVVLLSSSSGTTRTSKSVRYEAYLGVGSEKTFTYRFKITDYIDFVSQPISNFSYQGAEQVVKIGSKTVKVNKPYTLTVTLSPKSMEATEQTALSIKIENEVSDDIEVEELKITIPSFISLQSKPGELTKKNEKYYWSGTVDPDSYELINLLLRPIKSGTFEIPVTLKVIDVDEKEFYEEKTVTITSTIKNIEPILSIIDDSVSEGAYYRLAFSVKNNNERVSLLDIKARLVSDMFPDIEVELDELLPDNTKTLLVREDMSAPFLDKKKTYTIEAKGTYETSTHEKLDFSKSGKLTVTPVDEAITIIQVFSKKEVEAGGNVTMTVEIKNNNDEPVTVDVSDEYSDGLIFIGGETVDTLFFDDAGREQAYAYSLRVPMDYDKDEIIVTTTAVIQGKNYKDIKNTSVSVVFPEPIEEEEEEGEEEEPAPKDKEEKEVVKAPGFFRNVFQAIEDFFNRLFGK